VGDLVCGAGQPEEMPATNPVPGNAVPGAVVAAWILL
jgi:hypothetical protein